MSLEMLYVVYSHSSLLIPGLYLTCGGLFVTMYMSQDGEPEIETQGRSD